MTPEDAVRAVLAARDWAALTAELKLDYRGIAKLIHPDKCRLRDASRAFDHLTKLKNEGASGRTGEDDSGPVRYWATEANFTGDHAVLRTSVDNLRRLGDLAAGTHFRRYLPKHASFTKEKGLVLTFEGRTLPLEALPRPLPQDHLNWVLSRLLEISLFFSTKGWVHAGINPWSVWVVPETRGVVLTSFYHATPKGERLRTLSGRWRHFYPRQVFAKKEAEPWLDVECAKRTACWLAGDATGAGHAVRHALHPEWWKFVNAVDTGHPFEVYDKYRKMLDTNFPKRFVPLTI